MLIHITNNYAEWIVNDTFHINRNRGRHFGEVRIDDGTAVSVPDEIVLPVVHLFNIIEEFRQ